MNRQLAVLAIDCAGAACAVALWRDGAIAAASRQQTERGHASLLAPAIAAIAAQAGIAMGEIGLVAVTTGPGSFTGIRIGLATARGLALALACPLAGFNCFEALALSLDPAEVGGRTLLSAIDSRREEIFIADASGGRHIARAQDFIAALAGGNYLVLGDGAALLIAAGQGRKDLSLSPSRSAASIDVAALAGAAAARGAEFWRQSNASAGLPKPLYLRPPDVTLRAGAVAP